MKIAWFALALVAAAAAAEVPEADDPMGRMRAQHAGDSGVRTPEMQQEILRVAQSEALRYGIGSAVQQPTAVAGSAWVNIGPTTADYEVNGKTYFKVDSGRARRILVDPRNADVVYLATSGGGVWKTRNATSTAPGWAPVTDGIVSLSVGSLAINPAAPDSLVLGLGDPFDVAVPGYSILTSDDGGQTWSGAVALSGAYPGSAGVYTASSVRDLAVDPGGAIVLAATDAGLFRHTGGGVGTGWALIDLDVTTHDLQDCWSLAYAGPDTWVLACRDAFNGGLGKIWRSTNGGLSWSDQTGGLGAESSDVGRITVAAAAQGTGSPWRVYALAANKAGSDQKDVFRSNDGGVNWGSLSMHGNSAFNTVIEVPLNPTDDQPDLDFVHGQAFYNQMLVVDPGNPDAVFIGGNLSMGRSTDGGAHWMVMTDWLPWNLQANTGGLDTNVNTMAQYAHADWHTATVARVGGAPYFWGGNDGGLIRPTSNFLTDAPGSVTWDDKVNRGIASHLVYSVASGKERISTTCTPGGGDIVYGGFQDNGTRTRVLSGASSYVGYNQIAGGDGFGVGLGCNSSGTAMGSHLLRTYVSRIDVSTDGGANFNQVVSQSGAGLSPAIQLDPNLTFNMKVVTDLSSDFIYLTPLTRASTLDGWVYRSTDNGASWSSINGTIHLTTGGTATVFAKPMRNVASQLLVNGMYAAVSGGRVYVTVNAGAAWTESNRAYSTNSSNYLSMAAVAFDPNDTSGNTVWIGSPFTSLSDGTALPTSQPHLYKCTGTATAAGASCTGVSASSGLPAVLPVNVVKVDPGNSSVIYVGTEIGMYRSINGGSTFTRYGTGLPLVSVTDIAVNADDSAIRVSTFGRGFWEIYPDNAAKGVAGNGDLDNSGVLDGFDLVREAAIEFNDRTTADFNPVGDLLFNNVIDESDVGQLLGALGGTP